MFFGDSLTEWLYFQIFCRIHASVKRLVVSVLLVDEIGGVLFCMTEVDRCFILLEHTYMLAEEALWDDQNHMLTYVHWIFLWITYVLTSEIASSWTWALLLLDVFGWFFDGVIVLSNLLPYSSIPEEIRCVVGGWDWRGSLLHDWSIQVFHFVWTYMLAEEALWDDQNHMLTYVHWIILWITYVLTSEIASSWTWVLQFFDLFLWFFDGVIVLSNLLPHSCVREETSCVCVVGWWHWRGSLLHDWSIQVFHFVWTYMLAEEALWDDQNHMLTYVHWIILWITYVLTSEIASSWTWALLLLDVFGWFFDGVIALSNLLPYSSIPEEIRCVVGGWDWRGFSSAWLK